MTRPAPFVFLICLAETLSMTGTMYFPALLPSFQAEWGLTNTAAGWINGVFFAGYAITSPILVGLTDRVDARRIYLPCAFLAALSLFLFGWSPRGSGRRPPFASWRGWALQEPTCRGSRH